MEVIGLMYCWILRPIFRSIFYVEKGFIAEFR